MNVRADLDSTLHFDLSVVCPHSALNAIMAHRYTQAQAARNPAVAREIENRDPAVSSCSHYETHRWILPLPSAAGPQTRRPERFKRRHAEAAQEWCVQDSERAGA